MRWHWGRLKTSVRLPRVSIGGVLISLAKWNLTAIETATLSKEKDVMKAVTRLRKQKGLPRWLTFYLGEGRSFYGIPLDLENPLSVKFWLHERGGKPCELQEVFGSTENGIVSGPDGRYNHDLIIPFIERAKVRRQAISAQRDRSTSRFHT